MRLVVIGGVAAGLSAAARARRIDPSLEILVLEKGSVVSYGACGLPFLVDGRVRRPEELVVYSPEYFRRERNITVRTGARVTAISHARREVLLESGERIAYDRLVVATGARPAGTRIPGADQPYVFTLHTLDDGIRLRDFLREKRPWRAVVVGAGYLGIEAADALRRNGLQVTVLESSPFALQREDPQLTREVSGQLKQYGVELRCGTTVSSIDRHRVADITCDLVVIGAGLRPNVELASEAGIRTGRTGALGVDDRMETNLRGVFAAGDCAETFHLVSERPAWIPLGTTANKMGRVAGANAAGGRERFAGITGTSIVSIFDRAFASTGLTAEEARRDGFEPVSARIEARERARYLGSTPTTVELICDRSTRRLLGGSVVGEQGAAGRINVIAAALAVRMRLDEFAQLDLAYAPAFAPAWDPLLVAAQQLAKQV